MTQERRNLVLVFDHGGMAGVFGAGVATAFEDANLYPRVHSIYSASAGAHNAAYWLARQSHMGSTIYFDELFGKRFINPGSWLKFMPELLLNSQSKVPP